MTDGRPGIRRISSPERRTRGLRSGAGGYRGVISDAGTGVVAAQAALRSAALNIYINVVALEDKEFAQRSLAEIETLATSSAVDSEAVYSLVRRRLEP